MALRLPANALLPFLGASACMIDVRPELRQTVERQSREIEKLRLHPGATEIVPQRDEKLDRRASRALLLSTVFRVVSSPEAGQAEAERRAEFVEQLLIRRKAAPAKIRRWLYLLGPESARRGSAAQCDSGFTKVDQSGGPADHSARR